jgi:hypothetical protein
MYTYGGDRLGIRKELRKVKFKQLHTYILWGRRKGVGRCLNALLRV